jgi:hypothetical protein
VAGPALAAAVQAPIPGYALFSIRAIVWSTLVGSPLAGSILVAKNYRRLGRISETWPSVVVGLLATIVHLITLYESPIAGVVLGCIFLVAMGLIARALQGTAVKEHKNRHGRLASGWAAFGIALLCLMGIQVVIVGVFAYLPVRN